MVVNNRKINEAITNFEKGGKVSAQTIMVEIHWYYMKKDCSKIFYCRKY